MDETITMVTGATGSKRQSREPRRAEVGARFSRRFLPALRLTAKDVGLHSFPGRVGQLVEQHLLAGLEILFAYPLIHHPANMPNIQLYLHVCKKKVPL